MMRVGDLEILAMKIRDEARVSPDGADLKAVLGSLHTAQDYIAEAVQAVGKKLEQSRGE